MVRPSLNLQVLIAGCALLRRLKVGAHGALGKEGIATWLFKERRRKVSTLACDRREPQTL